MFGWLKRACSCVWGGLKTVAKKCCDGVKHVAGNICEGVRKVGHCVAKVWKKFSGQDVAEEAERRLTALENETRRRQSEFNLFMEARAKEINASLSSINACRRKLNEELFPQFCTLAGNFRNWSVADVGIERCVALKGGCGSVRSRDELMKIDFRNHPIAANALAVLTLGFFTRKRAKESLNQVKEEEVRMKAEFEKLEAEKTRVSCVLKALRQVERQFNGCLDIYSRVLDEVEYSVDLLRTGRCILGGEPATGQFDVEFLPERHQLSLKAADEITRIVFAIGARKYVSDKSKRMELVDKDVMDIGNGEDQCKKIEDGLKAA